ncbi:ABC-2 transporter permease [Clostridium baratii]|uniref:ABC-2 transporter permease n=2 Tax=Clostridium baratii TaxID=1561 RepID=UPI0006BA9BB1|nr:ABC-2 transporter permease [Clostridium baratii]
MINLLKMEFLVQKKFLKGLILMIVFTTYISLVSGGTQSIYLISTMIVFVLVLTTIEVEKRSNFNLCINSMPIKRSDYITAKYISALIYIISANMMFFILFKGLNIILKNEMFYLDVNSIILVISVQTLYMSIIIPIFIFLNRKYYRFANMLIIGGTTFIVGILSEENILMDLLNNTKSITFLCISSAVFILSWIGTNLIYEKRDVK